MAEHRVAAIHFDGRTGDGPCECTCGWHGKASGFDAHRRQVGAKATDNGRARTPDEFRVSRSSWNRCTPMKAER